MSHSATFRCLCGPPQASSVCSSIEGIKIPLVVRFFVHCAVADFDFFGEFRKSQTEMELEIENSLDMKLLLTHCGYFGVAALWIALACFRGKSCGGQRLAASGFFVFCDFCATGFSQVWAVRTGKFAGTVFPEMLQATTNMVAGAFGLFLMHSDEAVGENTVQKGEDQM